MLCPVCQNSAQRSTVRQLRTWKLTPDAEVDRYFDEDGNEHSHDPRVVMTEFQCSNGHRFAERSSWQCGCGWMACKAEIVEAPEPEVTSEKPARREGKVITAEQRKAISKGRRR